MGYMGHKEGMLALALLVALPALADQQPFNLQIHLKTTNAQPVPPAEVANWCASIKKNLPTEAIPANPKPNQAVIHCSPESSGMLVNLNLQYTPPPPPPPSTPVHFINSVSGNIDVYATRPDGSSYHSSSYAMGGEWDATLLTGSNVTIHLSGGTGSNKNKDKTVPSPSSTTHRAALECRGHLTNWKCSWSD